MIGKNIQGVILQDLRVVADERGAVLHMIRSDSPLYSGFGEIYFSEIKPNKIKAWKRHLKMTQHFAVPVGQIKLIIYDNRSDSSTQDTVCEYYLGRPDNYKLIKIPPGLWYGFQALGEAPAMIANLATLPHDPAESENLPINNAMIPYRWL